MKHVCDECDTEFTRADSLTRHVNNFDHIPEGWRECPECKKFYNEIGNHWQFNPDHRPDISDYQHEVITGVLMGDGCINEQTDTNCRLKLDMVTKEYLEYLDENVFPTLSNGVNPVESTDKRQDQYELQDKYRLNMSVHPAFNEYREWYESGEKVFPEDLEMTPTILKHWYVTDGNLQTKRYPSIRAHNERNNSDKIKAYFDDTPLTVSFSSGTLRFPSSKDDFFDYIGEPIPGFEYKWP